MARNRDRVGTPNPNVDNPPPDLMQGGQSEGFSFVIPTDFVELPSKGRYYPENHPLHGQESIEIKQMTAKEEDMLTSRTLLKKGIALDRVLNSVIMQKGLNADSLLVGDRNAIIVAMRVAGYGSDYNTTVSCPKCGATQEYGFDLQEADIYHGDDVSKLDIADNQNGTFSVTLPRTGIEVVFRLLTGYDEKALVASLERARKKQVPEKTVTTQLRQMIVSVSGDASSEAIKFFIENVPSMDSRHLRLAYELAAPNVDLTQHFECSECDHEQEMEVPLTADFFWPDR